MTVGWQYSQPVLRYSLQGRAISSPSQAHPWGWAQAPSGHIYVVLLGPHEVPVSLCRAEGPEAPALDPQSPGIPQLPRQLRPGQSNCRQFCRSAGCPNVYTPSQRTPVWKQSRKQPWPQTFLTSCQAGPRMEELADIPGILVSEKVGMGTQRLGVDFSSSTV